MLGIIIAIALLIIGIIIHRKYDNGLEILFYILFVFTLVINIIPLSTSQHNKNHYQNEIWKDVPLFNDLPIKYQLEFLNNAIEYEKWRLYNIDPKSNDFLYDWYFDDDAITAPKINIDSLYNIIGNKQ